MLLKLPHTIFFMKIRSVVLELFVMSRRTIHTYRYDGANIVRRIFAVFLYEHTKRFLS